MVWVNTHTWRPMSRKVFKISNYTGFDQGSIKEYVRTLDDDIRKLFRWVHISRERSIQLPFQGFRRTNSTDGTVGTTPTIDVTLLNATTELLSMYVHMPKDWDKDTDIDIELAWSLAQGETTADTLSLTCDYVMTKKETTGEGLAATSDTTTTTVDATTAFGVAQGDIYTTTFTLDKDDANNGWAFGDKTVGIGFEVHMTNITEVVDINFVGGTLNYTALY